MGIRCIDPKPQGAVGFTLIEVLIGITLMGVAISLLVSGLRFAGKVWTAGDDGIEKISQLQVVHRVMRDLLGRSVPATVGENDELEYLFHGSSERVDFVVYMPPYPDHSGLFLVTFAIENSDDKWQLKLKRVRIQSDLDAMENQQPDDDILLFEAKNKFGFSYFKSDENSEWQESWDRAGELPRLIRLQAPAQGDDNLAWPDMIVRVEADIDAACVHPEGAGRCRQE